MTRLVGFLMLCAAVLAIESGLHGASGQSREVGRGRSGEGVAPAQSGTVTVQSSRDPGGRIGGTPSSPIQPVPPPEKRNPAGRIPAHDKAADQPAKQSVDFCGDAGGDRYNEPVVHNSGFTITADVQWGLDITLADAGSLPDFAGFDFSEGRKKRFDDQFADMYVAAREGRLMMFVREDSDILEVGPAIGSLSGIFIPRKEWSPTGSVVLNSGFDYLVRTWDKHYAKFVVTSVSLTRVTINWAYQETATEEFAPVVMGRPR
jgi:hypothetical protein